MMNELNRICAFSDTRRHSLDRAIPDVSGDKNSRDTRFEEPWLAFERPILRSPSSFEQVRPGKNKSLFVAVHDASQPLRSRRGSNENEQGSRRNPLRLPACRTIHGNGFQPVCAEALRHLAVQLNMNVRRLL